MASVVSSIASAAHSAAVAVTSYAPIKPGDALPAVAVIDEEMKPITLHDIPGKIVIVGVPAAFSPTCSNQAPGYVEQFSNFQAKGVSQVFILAINDSFVMKAWKKKLAGDDTTPVHFVADDTGAFVSKLGLTFDATAMLGSPRAKRFVITAEGGKVEKVIVEDDVTALTVTEASAILAGL